MIVVLYAMEEEIRGIHDLLNDIRVATHSWAKVEIGKLGDQEILLAQCGVGKVFASITTQSLLAEYKPSLVVLCGMSGGLHPSYRRGDLVFGTEFIQHDMNAEVLGFLPGQIPYTDFRLLSASAPILHQLSSFSLDDAAVHFGRIGSGDQFISGNKGAELRSLLEIDLVDMESAAVALVCLLHKMPLIVARTISDGADHEAPLDFTTFLPLAARHVTQLLQFICSKKLQETL